MRHDPFCFRVEEVLMDDAEIARRVRAAIDAMSVDDLQKLIDVHADHAELVILATARLHDIKIDRDASADALVRARERYGVELPDDLTLPTTTV